LILCGVIIVQPPPRKIPRTIENTRENDETVCKPDDEEVLAHALRLNQLFLLMAKIANASCS